MTTAIATDQQEATELTTAALRLLHRATELVLESEELSEWGWLRLRIPRQATNTLCSQIESGTWQCNENNKTRSGADAISMAYWSANTRTKSIST